MDKRRHDWRDEKCNNVHFETKWMIFDVRENDEVGEKVDLEVGAEEPSVRSALEDREMICNF